MEDPHPRCNLGGLQNSVSVVKELMESAHFLIG